ncbi:MAG: tetratricopeptide repeat protein, partial [Bacteroidales bacterium]|nr:tetratricopeptide repeat protein [Bacteroidales bacterium]
MKYLRFYLLLLFLFSGIITNAQDSRVDSLKMLLRSMDGDTTKVNTLNAIADAIYRNDPDEAIRYSTDAKTLAEQINFRKGLALAYKNMGLGHYMQGDYTDAFKSWEPSLKIYEELGDDQ